MDKDKIEDPKVLKRSPDLLNDVKTGLRQLRLLMTHILCYHIWELWPFWLSDQNNLMHSPSNSLVISETKMFR